MIVVRLHHPPKMLWYLQASIGRRCHRKRRQTEYHMTDTHGIWLSITCQKSPWDPFRCEIHLPSAALDTILRNNELILEKICKHRHQVVECPPMKTYENHQPQVTLYLLTRYPPIMWFRKRDSLMSSRYVWLSGTWGSPNLTNKIILKNVEPSPWSLWNIYRSVSAGSQAQFQLQHLDSQSKRSRFFAPRRSNSIFNIRA